MFARGILARGTPLPILTVLTRLLPIAFLLAPLATDAGLCDALPVERMHLVAWHCCSTRLSYQASEPPVSRYSDYQEGSIGASKGGGQQEDLRC